MPATIAAVSTGTAISAAALTAADTNIEYYINEGMSASDIKTSSAWVRSKHIFRPEFWTGTAPYSRLVSGEVHYRLRPHDTQRRSIHHSEVNTGVVAGNPGTYVPVEGMTVTFSVPAAITSGSASVKHYVRANLSWYCHEMGGNGTTDEATDRCADFGLFSGGVVIPQTYRPLYTASGGTGFIALHSVKQYSIMYPVPITGSGTHSIGLRIRMFSRGDIAGGTAHDNWKHVVIWGRSINLSWFSL